MARLIKPSKYHRTIDGGELLRRREHKGWSQQQLAEHISVSRQFISQLESPGEAGDWLHEITTALAFQIMQPFRKQSLACKF